MFGFSGEHLLVLLIILLIFGPRRLPDLGHSIGRTSKNFKDGINGLNDTPSEKAAHTARLEAKAKEAAAAPAPSAVVSDVKEPVEKA